jgi:hypothetical protein
MRSRSALISPLLLGLVLGVTRPALAETQPVQVSYTAPAGCSTRAAFVQELGLRSARVRVVEAAERTPRFVVELVDRGAQVVGQLRLIEPDGSETARAVSGATCDEVVPALALIAAVLVDPESLTRQAEATPARPPSRATPPHPEPSPWRFRPTLAAGLGLASAVGPGLSLGALFELGLESEHAGKRGPAAAVALMRTTSPTRTTRAGDAYFTATLARLALCPLRWPSAGPVFLSPCAAFEAGSLRAEPSRTLGKQPVSVLWLAADPALSLEYRPLPVLSLGLDALGVFPLERDHFVFRPSSAGAPNISAFSVPSAGFAAGVGVKAIWP